LLLIEVREIVSRCQYLDWKFDVYELPPRTFYVLRVAFVADGAQHHGRKWLISRFSTPSEIVQTCLKAVLTAIEHEAREKFLYRGEAIFGPHFNVDALLGVATEKRSPPNSNP
jgi:hypothetical protein